MVELAGQLGSDCLSVHWDADHAAGRSYCHCKYRLDDYFDAVEVRIDASAEGLFQTDLALRIHAWALLYVNTGELLKMQRTHFVQVAAEGT